jgi:hypothetical protein
LNEEKYNIFKTDKQKVKDICKNKTITDASMKEILSFYKKYNIKVSSPEFLDLCTVVNSLK